MNKTPLWLRLLFGACLLVPALAAALYLVPRKLDCSTPGVCPLGEALAYGPLRGAVR